MSEIDWCLVHGIPKQWDMRSGMDFCRECEKQCNHQWVTVTKTTRDIKTPYESCTRCGEINDIKDGETVCEHQKRPFECSFCRQKRREEVHTSILRIINRGGLHD